jgi:hypothetical protein
MKDDTLKQTTDDVDERIEHQFGERAENTKVFETAASVVKATYETVLDNSGGPQEMNDEARSATESDNTERERMRLEEERKHHEAIGS